MTDLNIVVSEVSFDEWEQAVHAQHVPSIPVYDMYMEELNAEGSFLASFKLNDEGDVIITQS